MTITGSRSGNASLPPAVLTDFDDTAAAQNVAELLLYRFGAPDWTEVRERFRAGELNLKQYQEITFANIRASKAEMQSYVKENASLRPRFGELTAYCEERDIPVAVVSQGLDFYIEALLEGEGFPQVPVYSVNTSFDDGGIQYHYHYPYPGEEERGNSKGVIVEGFQSRGRRVFFAGDGFSDLEAAERADVVFAHKYLAEECGRRNIPFRPFRDFGDILAALREPGG